MPAEKRPLIGITPANDDEKSMTYLKNGYREGVSEAGGLPLLLPLTEDEDLLTEIIQRFDGILLSGGPDMDAKYFNEENLPSGGEISPYRDRMELFLARKAIELDRPLFAICRGVQVMNVAAGGSLYQDIYSQLKGGDLVKHSQSAPDWYPTHDIRIEKGSKVWASFLKDSVRVNSYHHQAIKDVAPGFKVTSRAADGIVESIENSEKRFCVGVQWHPERMWKQDREFLNLFKEFIKCCRD